MPISSKNLVRRGAFASLPLVLVSCTQPADNAQQPPGNDVAQIEEPNEAAPTPAAQTPPLASPPPDTAQTPPAEQSAEAAADVVRTYYAAIARGGYDAAWALWEDGGAASGMSAAAFAESFAKFASYRAETGAPGRIDAGAGQRYVEVPIRVYGTLRDGGRPFNMEGSVTLHRAADIPGATAEQRSWRIRSADIKPRP